MTRSDPRGGRPVLVLTAASQPPAPPRLTTLAPAAAPDPAPDATPLYTQVVADHGFDPQHGGATTAPGR